MLRGGEAPEQRWARQARHCEIDVDVNRLCGLRVLSWNAQQVVMLLPFDDWLWSNMLGSQHIAASYLAELCGTGASLAACVTKDSLVVVSTEANYFAPGCTDLTATGVCIETGPLRHVSKVRVRDADDRIIAEAIVTNAPPGPPSAD